MLHTRSERTINAQCEQAVAIRLRDCLWQIIDLVADAPDQSVSNLIEPIRHIVIESLEPTSDGEVCACEVDQIEQIVNLIIKELEFHRRAAIRGGMWFGDPTASSWFG
jgi:hypothetical protein